MIDLNLIDKEEAILIIKDFLEEMYSLRRQLKPILSDIVRAIDNNLFINPESEEIQDLLQEILFIQDRISQFDELKPAIATKKLAVIDEAIQEIDRQQVVNELRSVLLRFKNLICISEDENEIDAAKKLKRQAHKLYIKADKVSVETFASEGGKFIDVAKKIEDNSELSSNAFLEIQNNFPDNKFLAYTIMKHSIRFDLGNKLNNVSEAPAVVKKQSVDKNDQPEEEISMENIIAKRIDMIKTLAEECKVPFEAGLNNENEFTIEKKQLKKKMTVKSLNNKLREFIDGSESISFPILRTFCKCRIFSTDATFEDDQEDKSRSLIPVIVEKLFNWGIADKIHWKGMIFYYLNDNGQLLLMRVISIKDVKNWTSKNVHEPINKKIASSLRRFVLFSTIWSLKIKKENNKLDGDTNRFWIRSTVRGPGGLSQSFFTFSLLFFDENWLKNIDSFIAAFTDESKFGREVKGVFLISDLTEEQMKPWVKFFKTLGVENIYLFLIIKGGCKILNEAGEAIMPSEWCEKTSYGRIDETSAEEEDDNPSPQYEFKKKDNPHGADDDNNFDDEYIDDIGLTDNGDYDEHYTNYKYEYNGQSTPVEKSPDYEYEEEPNSKAEFDKPEILVDKNIQTPEKEDIDIDPQKNSIDNYVIAASKNFDHLSPEDKITQGLLLAITKFFIDASASRGMLFLHLLSARGDWASSLCTEIGYILDDPMSVQKLRNVDPFDFWDSYYSIPHVNVEDLYDYLNLAAIIKSFFAPPEPMSFQLKSRWNQINDDRSNVALKAYPSTKKLINLFKTFAEQTHSSFASCLNIDHSNAEMALTNATESIKTVRDRADAIVKMQIKHPRSKGLVKLLYETDGQVRHLLNVDNNSISVDTILDFCNNFSDMNFKRPENQALIVSEDIFSAAKIGEYLDEHWSSIKVDSHKNEKFTGVERVRQIKILTQALVALLSYAFAKKRLETIKKSGQHKAPAMKALEILNDIVEEFSNVDQDASVNFIGPAVFMLFIENLAAKINGVEIPMFYRDCLLGGKYLELTKDGIPIVESYGISAFSFESQVFEFENSVENLTPKEAVNTAYETAVRSCDLGVLKLLESNLRELIDRSDEELKRRRENVSKQVDRQLDRIYHEFLDNLELDRNYDRITNQEEIDNYINIATEAKEHFAETKNVGIFQRFINACNADIARAALPHKNAMEQRLRLLEERLETDLKPDENLNEKYPIISEIHRQLEIGNLTVAEDYMNRWEENGNHFNDFDLVENKNDAFDNFLKDYESIFNACIKNKSESLEKIHTRMRGGAAKNRSERDATDFVSAWQGLNTDLKSRAETSVVELLKHLTFGESTIDSSEKIPPNQWKFHVKFPEYRRSKAAYPHPFAVYGTDIASKGLTVIYLASNRTADNIIETLATGIKSDCGIICLVDFALSLAERRKLAQAFKTRPDLKDIIVIDRVMAIYLTRFEDNMRGVKMLKTALPFARVQPYTTGGIVAPEMFIGRSKELAKIRDMAGPVFVYGGRQLGKSALLRQVRNIENDPDNGNFAFFIELKGLDADKSLEKIVRELKESGLIDTGKTIGNWDDFSFAIKDLMSGKVEKIRTPKKLILLLDESDEFLASVENTANRAIDVLRELRETFSGSFKFVLAGLHKVIRFEKNSSFGNLDHISVLPFTPTDAIELLLKPMSCLGFVIEDQSLTSAIFSRANYYPGLIQYYCKMIVDATGDNYLQRNFDVTKNPPYKLDDEYLKNMLGKRDFQDEINKKFQITLKLDDDNFYEIIALVIAMAYYEKNRPIHVSIDKIKETCFIYDIDKIADMSDMELESLLGEMVELNLLRKVDDMYEFNRYAFWHMMGTENEVNSRLNSIRN